MDLINKTNYVRFDEALNEEFNYSEDFSQEALDHYIQMCGITTRAPAYDILISLNVAEELEGTLKFTNAGILCEKRRSKAY